MCWRLLWRRKGNWTAQGWAKLGYWGIDHPQSKINKGACLGSERSKVNIRKQCLHSWFCERGCPSYIKGKSTELVKEIFRASWTSVYRVFWNKYPSCLQCSLLLTRFATTQQPPAKLQKRSCGVVAAFVAFGSLAKEPSRQPVLRHWSSPIRNQKSCVSWVRAVEGEHKALLLICSQVHGLFRFFVDGCVDIVRRLLLGRACRNFVGECRSCQHSALEMQHHFFGPLFGSTNSQWFGSLSFSEFLAFSAQQPSLLGNGRPEMLFGQNRRV